MLLKIIPFIIAGMVAFVLIKEKRNRSWRARSRYIQNLLESEHSKVNDFNLRFNTNYTTKKGIEEYNKWLYGKNSHFNNSVQKASQCGN